MTSQSRCALGPWSGAWLVVGVLIMNSQALAAEPAELVIKSGVVLTLDQNSSVVQAVAVRGGKVIATGSNDEIQKLVSESTRVIDARGRMIVPGLIETHVHATGAARGEVEQEFLQLGSISEIQDWVRRQVARSNKGDWIRLPRVDVTRIRERRLPTRADLDAAAPDHPAVFNWQYANRQVQILNSAALRQAGITPQTQPPAKGKIKLDANGELTGVLEDCGALTAKFLPRTEVSDEQYLASLEKLLRRYNELGITSIMERGSSAEGFRTYQKLKAQDKLTVRATVTIRVGTAGTLEEAEKAIRGLSVKPREGDDWVRVGPLKIGVDGGVLYGTAYLREPYGEQAVGLYGLSDPLFRGLLQNSPEKITNFVRAGHRLGWQLSTHVTGDAGVDAVLDAVEAANTDSPIHERRFTLIHAYFPSPDTAKRAARLGVCVDTQPAWYYKDGDALATALGGQRMDQFIGLQIWRDAGVKVILNSDHMQGFGSESALNPFDPFLTMYTAISRKTESGAVFGSRQKISREAALRMMTTDAAYMTFDESNRGSLEVGKYADLAVLSNDFLKCDESSLKDIQSVMTIVDGKVVYQDKVVFP